MKAVLIKTVQGLHGATDDDEAVWQAFRRKLDRMKPGTYLRMEWATPRSGPQHRKIFALITLITENSEVYDTKPKALVAIKLAAGYFDPYVDPTTGQMTKVPHSIAFESMEQDAFNHFFSEAVTAICSVILPKLDEATAYRLIDQIVMGWGG